MKFGKYSVCMLLVGMSLSASVSAAGVPLVGIGAPQEEEPFQFLEPETEVVEAETETFMEVQTMVESEESIGEETEANNDSSMPVLAMNTILPKINLESWELVLANASHPIGEYAPQTGELEGIELDYRIIDAAAAFIDDARAEGLPVFLSSGYRDYDTQNYLNQLQQSYGYTQEEADQIVAPAGTSEHQTGLACDITDYYREFKNDELEDTDTYKWMSAHCQDYGFIVRYPKGKDDITGIIYEPWHYRYVGKEAAKYIMENHLCLEEFLEYYQ